MHFFNTGQVLAIWSALPFGIQWASNQGKTTLVVIGGLAWFVGYVILTVELGRHWKA